MIKLIIRSGGNTLYVPNSFPNKSSNKQLIAVCRDYLNAELPGWVKAALDVLYYKKGIFTNNKLLSIKNEK